MKVAIPTPTNTNETIANPRFGRANFFCIVDSKTGEKEFIANPAIEAAHGAGVQSGQLLIDQNVEAVISAKYGPNASSVLRSGNIKMFLFPDGSSLKIEDLMADLNSNKLVELS